MPTTRYINSRFNQELADEEQRIATSSLVAASYIQGWLSHFAFTNRIAEATLTARVSSILSDHEVWGGASDSVRVGALPGRTTGRTVGVQPLEVASDARTHGAWKKGEVKKVGRKPKHKQVKWTEAMRKAAASRMRRMWRQGKFSGNAQLKAA